jgi:hypothetical protein
MSHMERGWALIATHLPGRTGRECQQRWATLSRESKTFVSDAFRAARVQEPRGAPCEPRPRE